MAKPALQSGGGSGCKTPQEEKTDARQPTGPTTPQRARACFLKGISYFSGDMEVLGKWMKKQFILLQILDWVLRGAAQVMFVSNPLTGLIIFGGLILQNYWLTLNGFVGTLSATMSALILRQNRDAIAAGLYGYNGMLLGLLMAVYSDGGDWYWWLLLPNIFMCMMCSILYSAVAAFNSSRDLPVFCLPFNVLLCLHMAANGHYNPYLPQVLIQPRTELPNITWADIDIAKLFKSVPVGVGQVYGCDNPWSGGIFMIAVVISSPIVCVHAVLGSAIGMISGLAVAAPLEEIYFGLWGYNCVLASIAIGGTFYALTWQVHLLTITCAFFCGYFSSAVTNILATFGLPTCTWPFCLSAYTFLQITTEAKKIFKLPLEKIVCPEKNLRFYWKFKKQEKMEKEDKEREEKQMAMEKEMKLKEKEQLRLEMERMEEEKKHQLKVEIERMEEVNTSEDSLKICIGTDAQSEGTNTEQKVTDMTEEEMANRDLTEVSLEESLGWYLDV